MLGSTVSGKVSIDLNNSACLRRDENVPLTHHQCRDHDRRQLAEIASNVVAFHQAAKDATVFAGEASRQRNITA